MTNTLIDGISATLHDGMPSEAGYAQNERIIVDSCKRTSRLESDSDQSKFASKYLNFVDIAVTHDVDSTSINLGNLILNLIIMHPTPSITHQLIFITFTQNSHIRTIVNDMEIYSEKSIFIFYSYRTKTDTK
jgi:hypothetical protein